MKRTLAALLVLSLAAPAAAQTTSDHDLALALFKHSDEAYKRGDFRGAVNDLEKAYSLEPVPVLLYNLGRAYEGLGETKKAIDAYERYLKAQPEAEDRGAIQQRLVTLHREAAREEERANNPPPPPPVVVVRSRPLGAGPIVVTSIGAAGLVAGGVLGALALSTSSNENSPQTSQLDAQSAHDRGAAFATGANVAFIAGGVIAIAGIVWLIVDRVTSSSSSASASVPFVVRF